MNKNLPLEAALISRSHPASVIDQIKNALNDFNNNINAQTKINFFPAFQSFCFKISNYGITGRSGIIIRYNLQKILQSEYTRKIKVQINESFFNLGEIYRQTDLNQFFFNGQNDLTQDEKKAAECFNKIMTYLIISTVTDFNGLDLYNTEIKINKKVKAYFNTKQNKVITRNLNSTFETTSALLALCATKASYNVDNPVLVIRNDKTYAIFLEDSSKYNNPEIPAVQLNAFRYSVVPIDSLTIPKIGWRFGYPFEYAMFIEKIFVSLQQAGDISALQFEKNKIIFESSVINIQDKLKKYEQMGGNTYQFNQYCYLLATIDNLHYTLYLKSISELFNLQFNVPSILDDSEYRNAQFVVGKFKDFCFLHNNNWVFSNESFGFIEFIPYSFGNQNLLCKISYVTCMETDNQIIFSIRSEVDIMIDFARQIRDSYIQSKGLLARMLPQTEFEDFDGTRGTIDIERSIIASVENGQYMASQRFKSIKKEDPIYLYAILDISGSMSDNNKLQNSLLIANTVFSMFERKFKKAILGFIGDKRQYEFQYDTPEENKMTDKELSQKYEADRLSLLNQQKIADIELTKLSESKNALEKELRLLAPTDPQYKIIQNRILQIRDQKDRINYYRPSEYVIRYYASDASQAVGRSLEIKINKFPISIIFSNYLDEIGEETILQTEKTLRVNLKIPKVSQSNLIIQYIKTNFASEITDVYTASSMSVKSGANVSRMYKEFASLRKFYVEIWNSYRAEGTNTWVMEDMVNHKYMKNKGLKYFIIITDAGVGGGGNGFVERSYNRKTGKYENIGSLMSLVHWIDVLTARKDTRTILILVGGSSSNLIELGGNIQLNYRENGDSFQLTEDILQSELDIIEENLTKDKYYEAFNELKQKKDRNEISEYGFLTEMEELDRTFRGVLTNKEYFTWMKDNINSIYYTTETKLNHTNEIQNILDKLLNQRFFINLF